MRDDIAKTIHGILAEADYTKNPYIESLRNGSFDKDDFVETQIQFQFAVVFFSRPMAALAAKIPLAALRVEVLRNVWEEHGEGDLSRMHGRTFMEFLSRVAGITEADIARRALWPEVRIFNTTLAGACVLDDYLVGCGMMGTIERMFCDISALIGGAVIDRGWLARDRLIHYNAHETLDIRHAEDFFEVLEPAWAGGPENRYFIEQGFRLGATLFGGLYEGLYRARKRRIFRETSGPHIRTDMVNRVT